MKINYPKNGIMAKFRVSVLQLFIKTSASYLKLFRSEIVSTNVNKEINNITVYRLCLGSAIQAARQDPVILGWCEIKLLSKSQNPQAVFSSLLIPEQLLSQNFYHRIYQFYKILLKNLHSENAAKSLEFWIDMNLTSLN